MNPVELWSSGRLLATVSLLALTVVVSMALIAVSDRPLGEKGLPRSAKLEWPLRPRSSAAIIEKYADAHVTGDVVRGVLLDSLFLVPSYSALLAIGCFWAARALPAPWSDVGLALGWAGFVTGGLDLIENCGILVQLLMAWTFAAPLTGAVCRMKWTLLGVSAAYAVFARLLFQLS